MIDLEHCNILGGESIDSNSLNRCIFNLYMKMGEFNTHFLNATSENVPSSPFFSGGYENALTENPSISHLNAQEATTTNSGVVKRLYRGAVEYSKLYSDSSLSTESVTGNFLYENTAVTSFAPTVETLTRDSSPLILKSILDTESSIVSETKTLDITTSPTIKYTSYMLGGRTGVSFGTITFKRNNGDKQKNEISLDVKSDLIGIYGVDRIKFFTIGNGISSGVKSISENFDMVTDVGPCSVTYNSDSDIVISNITKNNGGDDIIIDKETGRILDADEDYDYTKCIILSNNEISLNFFIIFELKQNVIEYTDDMWCFNIVPNQEIGIKGFYDSTGFAEGYSKFSFAKFEAIDDGYQQNGGEHIVWGDTESEDGGCTTIANDAFRNCKSATFQSLCWFSPRLRQASRLFQNCTNAVFTKLPSTLALNKLTHGRQMFDNCKTAKFNEIHSIEVPNASDISMMFSGCRQAVFASLENLTIKGNASNMFNGDENATFSVLNSINGGGVDMNSMFVGCNNARFDNLVTVQTSSINGNVNTSNMFKDLTHPTFGALSSINISSTNGYNGTSMFEGCTNSTFANLKSLGNVVNGTRMFANLDNIGEESDLSSAEFKQLHSLGNKIKIGREMFINDTHMNVVITDSNCPVEDGRSMFENTSSIVFNGNLPNLTYGSRMFSNTNTAVVKGNIPSLTDGASMFSFCGSADVSGTTDSLSSMENMFLSSDYVHFQEVPEVASNMLGSFSGISGECLIENWKDATQLRYCDSTFENSSNIKVSGNIIGGFIADTTNMFNNAAQRTGSYVLLSNPSMSSATDAANRYYSSNVQSDFGLFYNYDTQENPHFSFIGSINNTEESLRSGIATSDDVEDSFLCFETINTGGQTEYTIYTTSETPSATDITNDLVTYAVSSLDIADGTPVNVYRIDKDYHPLDKFGTFIYNVDENGNTSVTLTSDGYDVFSSETTFANKTFTPDDKPRIQTFNVVDSSTMSYYWKNADNMFHNVVQSSLLSGYDTFIAESLISTSNMFALDEFVSNDRTFDNTGTIFKRMQRSNIANMNGMFLNRNVSDANVFSDIYNSDYNCNTSFLIPHHVETAVSAFANTHISKTVPYIYLRIPETLDNAECMFCNYDGPAIRFEYDEDEWIYFKDGIKTDRMFENCSFYDDKRSYKFSVPSIYQQIFDKTDFSLDKVSEFDFRNDINFAYPYSDTLFFNNWIKMMGCSSVSFQNLQNDITDFFNSYSTTVGNAINVECVYLATVVSPKNYTYTQGNETLSANFELMTGTYKTDNHNSGEDVHKLWNISMVNQGSFTTDMLTKMREATNTTLIDSVTSLSNKDNRMTCTFCPEILFNSNLSKPRLGDNLWMYIGNDKYNDVYDVNTIFGNILSEYKSNANYRNVTLSSVEKIGAKELTLAFMGMSKPTFNSLIEVGDSILAGYGAFMTCENAEFDNLSSISVFQNESENSFTSRFASNSEEKLNWFGNYNNMFAANEKASYKNLKNITFNTKYAIDSQGNDVMLWVDEKNEVYYSCYDVFGRVNAYNLKITTYKKDNFDPTERSKYLISLYEYSGDTVVAKEGKTSKALVFYTDVIAHEHAEFVYELCEIDNRISVVIEILDENNVKNYFIANTDRIYSTPMHPKNGYAKFDENNFSLSGFVVNETSFIDNDRFVTLDGNSYTISTGVSEEDNTYVMEIVNNVNENDVVMKLGSAYKVKRTETDDGVDIKNMWYSRACYESEGVNYTAITIFKSTTTPSFPVEYPSDAVCYRIYNYEGNMYVDEMLVIPGTVDFKSLTKLENKTETLMSHKAFCSGMFKNCKNATFEKLDTINIPMSGSCAEMFGGCLNMVIDENKFKTFILPEAYNKGQDGDYKNYQKFFDGIPMSNIKLNSLNKNNTNLGRIGKVYEEKEGKSYHIIGKRFFDGITRPIGESGVMKKFDVEGGDPFTYQNAIFDLQLDCDIAKQIFDVGQTHNVTFYDVYGAVIKSIDVEYITYSGSTVNYKIHIPTPPDVGVEFKNWSVNTKSGVQKGTVAAGVTEYSNIDDDLEFHAVYDVMSGLSIISHEVGKDNKHIVTHSGETENEVIVTSLNSSKSTPS